MTAGASAVHRRARLGALGLVAALVLSCGGDPGPLVAPGTLVAADPELAWVAKIAWSADATELAFLATSVGGDLRVFRAGLTDLATTASEAGGFQGASELRYVPGGNDLITVGRPAVAPVGACAEAGVVVVRGMVAEALVGCPYEPPFGVIGRAGNAEVDADQFVVVHPTGRALVVPSERGAVWVDLATFETRDVGPGYPVAFDPSGERLLIVESTWEAQAWAVVTVADGVRTDLAVVGDRFGRGYHVIGVRWLGEGLILLLERDLADGSVWTRWNLDTGEERVLGPAREEIGAFPLGRVPRWSASGRLLAFREYQCLRESLILGCAAPRWSIVVVDVETGERRTAYRGQEFVDAPAIAPDDGAVAFAMRGEVFVQSWR